MKKDSLLAGIIAGLIGPLLGLIIYYFVVFYPQHAGFTEFLLFLEQNKQLLTAVSSLSLLANAVLFTIALNRRSDQTAKGIFISTLVYGIGVLLFKLVG